MLAEAGVAGFRTSESCADAIRVFLSWHAPAKKAQPAISAKAQTVVQSHRGPWNERAALGLFGALGVSCVRQAVVSLEDAGSGRASIDLRFPVVVKLLSADLPHKTEAGAVTLGVRNAEEMKSAVLRMMESARAYAPQAKIEGVLVQEQRPALVEAILGFRRDPTVGPVITLGMGGILAEIYRDIALRRPPIDTAEARAMIEDVKGFAVIRGYRGRPRGDLDALAEAVARFSQIAGDATISEAEINPLLIGPEGQGVIAVDGLVSQS
jgi:acyl-CoA synthetase (NDP forming)